MFDMDIIYSKFNLKPDDVVIVKWGARPEATVEDILWALYNYDNKAYEHLGLNTSRTLVKYIKLILPDINFVKMRNRPWESWFLSFTDNKRCGTCKEIVSRDLFNKDKATVDGLKNECKSCIKERVSTPEARAKTAALNKRWAEEHPARKRQRAYEYYYKPENREKVLSAQAKRSAKRRAIELQALPAWADLHKIAEIYANRPSDCHVDHIIPLQGDTVCGLHVENNLQYLTKHDNLAKGNKLLPEYTC